MTSAGSKTHRPGTYFLWQSQVVLELESAAARSGAWPARTWARAPGWVRILVLVAAATAFLALAASAIRNALDRPASGRLADLNVYLGAVHAVQHGTPLYSYAAANGDQFTYPPFALMVFWPLAGLPLGVVQLIWTVVTVGATLAIAAAITARCNIRGRRRLAVLTLAGGVVLLHSAPLHSNLRLGQVSVFVVLLALLDALELLPRRWAGVLIGLAAAIKLTPLLFVPYLWIVGRRRDAVRALATFGGAAAVAFVVWPQASTTFWTRAIFTTSRIGDLSATGNQSINGALLRYQVPTGQRTLAWWALAAAVCVVALLCAREYHRQGRVTYAAVVVGCATIAASPVSWTHHQVWTVLAGLLLVTGSRRSQILGGAVLLAVMSFSVGGLLRLSEFGAVGGFVGDNLRLLGALGVCCGGVATLWQAAPARASGSRTALRSRRAVVYSAVLAAAALTMLLITRDRLVSVQVYSASNASAPVWAGQIDEACGDLQPAVVHGRPAVICADAVEPIMDGLQLNFGSGPNLIVGQVGSKVARLAYIPIQGGAPVNVPLLPLPPAPTQTNDLREGSDGRLVTVIAHRDPGTREFAVSTNDMSDALLFAYDAQGNVIGTGGDKLHES